MNADYINSFLIATFEIFKTEIQESVSLGVPKTVITSKTRHEISVSIEVFGDVKGYVTFCCNKELAKKYSSTVMQRDFNDDNQLIVDGFGELANIIMGRASCFLDETGFKTEFSPPIFHIGIGDPIYSAPIKTLEIPVQTSMGDVSILIGLRLN